MALLVVEMADQSDASIPVPAMSAVLAEAETLFEKQMHGAHSDDVEDLIDDPMMRTMIATVFKRHREKRKAELSASTLIDGDASTLSDTEKRQGPADPNRTMASSDAPTLPTIDEANSTTSTAFTTSSSRSIPTDKGHKVPKVNSSSKSSTLLEKQKWSPQLILSATKTASSSSSSSTAAGTVTGAGGQSTPSHPQPWPIPSATLGKDDAKKDKDQEDEEDPSELFKDSVDYGDKPIPLQANTSFHNIDQSASREPGPDPRDAMRATLASAPANRQKMILREKLIPKILSLIPGDEKEPERNAFLDAIMPEDNLLLIDRLCL